MAAKPTAKEQKELRDTILKDLKQGYNLKSKDGSGLATKVGDIITITDIARVYEVDRALARAALQRLSGKDVSPAVLERVKQGQYRVVRLPQGAPSSKGPQPTERPVTTPRPHKSPFPILNIDDQLTVAENPWGAEFEGQDVFFLKVEETGEFVLARIKLIDIPEI